MTLLKEHDLGTWGRPGPATVELEVDGLPVTVPEGTWVMRAAALAGVDVPKILVPPTAWLLSAPAACASSRSPVGAGRLRRAPLLSKQG